MWWFNLKWFVRGWFFVAKKHVFCRFSHRRDRCYPEVWGRGLDGPWHCSRCVPCGTALDFLIERLELEKKLKEKT